MTTRAAFILFAIIVGLILLDVQANDGSAVVYLGRKFVDLLQYIAFWR